MLGVATLKLVERRLDVLGGQSAYPLAAEGVAKTVCAPPIRLDRRWARSRPASSANERCVHTVEIEASSRSMSG